MRLLVLILVFSISWAQCSQANADNTVIVDQIGDNNTFTIEQNKIQKLFKIPLRHKRADIYRNPKRRIIKIKYFIIVTKLTILYYLYFYSMIQLIDYYITNLVY